MKIFIRADASFEIGTGHVMRTVALAERVKERRWEPVFITRRHKGHYCDWLERKGFMVECLTEPKGNPSTGKKALKHASWLGTTMETDADECVDVLQAANPKTDWL